MKWAEALRFSLHALRSNMLRTILTAVGLLIGNMSVILVVTISLTSRDYILEQIRGIGSNMIYGYYEAGNRSAASVESDFVKMADVQAIRDALGSRIIAATGTLSNYDRIVIQGKEKEILVLGSDDQYLPVRNLLVLAGRFMDRNEVDTRQRVAMLTEKLAIRMYGDKRAAPGQVIKLFGLEFNVIGVFKERAQSFGLSELADESVLVPYTVLKYFAESERVDPLYVQARRPQDVEPLTQRVRQIVENRHRPGAKYYIANLGPILETANGIALILSGVLILIAAITLIISGIGISNIMFVTVTERTREIGVRMAVGAARKDVMAQFLMEAIIISTSGGLIGIVVGVALPLTVRYFTDIHIPISGISIAIAFVTSFLVGLVFGILPANRAARLNPTEALRYE